MMGHEQDLPGYPTNDPTTGRLSDRFVTLES